MGSIWQQPVKVQGAKFKQKSHNLNSSNIQVSYTILKVIFLLIPPQCPISNRLHSESTINDCSVTTNSQKNTAIFPAKERSHKKHKEIKMKSLTFDDLHQMTLIGLHVTQYMYVLFDKVHICLKKISVYIGVLCSVVPKTSNDFAESHINLQKYSL